MDRQTVDALLTGMLESADGVSDLLFITGKPPLVEAHGRLSGFPIDSAESVLTPALIEEIAAHIMNGSERLRLEFSSIGSCDCSYAIEDLARFRVNIFKQNGKHAIVMRKLQSTVPTLEKLGAPPNFPRDRQGKGRHHPSHGRRRHRQNDDAGSHDQRVERDSGSPHRDPGRPD